MGRAFKHSIGTLVGDTLHHLVDGVDNFIALGNETEEHFLFHVSTLAEVGEGLKALMG
jgi:hypothetical protein